MKLSKKLSPAVVESAKSEAEPYRVWDTAVPQLFLRVQPSGIKSFNVQWSRASSRSLGKWPGVTVESARTKAKAALIETDAHGAPLAVIEEGKPPPDKPLTLGEFITQHYEPWALSNQKTGAITIANLRAVHADLLDKLLTDLSAFDFERHKSARIKSGTMVSTVNRDLSRIRAALSRAVDWEMLAVHPMKRVKPLAGEDDSRVRYLSDAEEKRLRDALSARDETLKAARARTIKGNRAQHANVVALPAQGFGDYLAPLVLLALNTGCRRGELLGLDWKAVDLHRRLLTVVAATAKSGKTRHIPLNDESVELLTRWKAQSGDKGLVFPGPAGTRMLTITTSWRALAKAAELEDFRFHDLRHTFASHLVQRGADLYVVKQLMGHSEFEMTQRYAHLAPGNLAAAVALLGAR